MEKYTLQEKEIKNKRYGEIGVGELEEKKSRFITYIFSIDSNKQGMEYVELIRKRYNDARHVVYIYSYLKNGIVNIRSSDDGEPKGTGTKAIYEFIEKETLTNICVITVRYFGGILLGAGPLSRAYFNSFKNTFKTCEKIKMYNYVLISKSVLYSKYKEIERTLGNYCNDNIIQDLTVEFTDIVTINCSVREEYYEEVVKKLL